MMVGAVEVAGPDEVMVGAAGIVGSVDVAVIVDPVEVVLVVGSVEALVTADLEVVDVIPEMSLFEGVWLVTGELSFPLLFTRHIMSTPIAVVIKEAETSQKDFPQRPIITAISFYLRRV